MTKYELKQTTKTTRESIKRLLRDNATVSNPKALDLLYLRAEMEYTETLEFFKTPAQLNTLFKTYRDHTQELSVDAYLRKGSPKYITYEEDQARKLGKATDEKLL